MFKNAVELFDVFGFKIRVDPSWLLIAALIVWSLSTSYFPYYLPGFGRTAYMAMAVLAMLGLFGSLILHELSHSLVARRFGLDVGGITLFLFGGVAELEHEPRDPNSEFWIAAAGPVMSLGLAAIAFAITGLFADPAAPTPFLAVIGYLGLINFVLAIFNLVPAFPLDGGRILRAILWNYNKDLISATRIASRMGTIFASILIVFGVLSLFSNYGVGGLWQILIGFFILSASTSSYQQLVVRQALKNQTVGDLMSRDPICVEADSSVADVVDNVMLKHNVSFVPVIQDSRLLGYLDTQTINGLERERWTSTKVADIMVSADAQNTVSPDLETETLFEKMAQVGQRKFLIVDKGKLVGVIALSDLLTYLAIRQGLGVDRPIAKGGSSKGSYSKDTGLERPHAAG